MANTASTIERTFNVTRPARLTLENVSGEIHIQGGDDETISVSAVKQPGRGFDQTTIEMEQAADGAVRVATRQADDFLGRLLNLRFNGPGRVDYVVRVPRETALTLNYVSGPARVTGLHGALDLHSVDGPLDLVDVSGTLRVTTVSGAVSAARLSLAEPLRLETVSGEVDIADSRLPGAQATTVSGDVYVESDLSTGAYRLTTVSGDVEVRLPAGTRGVVHLSSLSGTLHSDLPGVQHRPGADGTGVSLHVSSVSGDVTLSTSGSTRAAAPPAPPAAEDRLALLDRLARGEVSVDEALKNLNAPNA